MYMNLHWCILMHARYTCTGQPINLHTDRWTEEIDRPSFSALKINVLLFVATSNLSSPTLVTLVMKAVEMIPLEYTSCETAHTHSYSVKQIYISHITCRLRVVCICIRLHVDVCVVVCVCLSPFWESLSQWICVCRSDLCNNDLICMCVLLPFHCQNISGSQHLASPIVAGNKGPCVWRHTNIIILLI